MTAEPDQAQRWPRVSVYAYKIDYVNYNRWISVEKSNDWAPASPNGLSRLSLAG